MKLARSFAVAGAALMLTLVACASSDSSSSGGSACAQAKSVADTCNAKPQDGGAKVTLTFDQGKCEGSDQGKKAAQCIVDNKNNCDCILKCTLTGACS